jgi:excisionase family DNA binding protein
MEQLGVKVKDAAKALGVSNSWLYEKIKEGKIPCVEIGGRKLISAEGLRKMFSQTQEQQQA